MNLLLLNQPIEVLGDIDLHPDYGILDIPFLAGDAFLTPAGFTGTWEIVKPAKKFYAFYG